MLVERTSDGGRKILISGGGRCNVLPAALEPERFITASPPHLLRHILRSWPLEHQKRFFEHDLGIPLKFEAEDRKYFPVSDRARDVRDALIAHARERGVEMRFSTTVTSLEKTTDGWRVGTSHGDIDASAVILATGGLSVPKTGSDGAGIRIAEHLGHTVHPLYPALTPLVADPPIHAGLSGVSVHARIRAKHAGKVRVIEGQLLFTHRGYSGPAALDASGPETTYRVSWGELDREAWEPLLTGGVGLVASLLGAELPQRLVEQLMSEANVPHDRKLHELRRAERVALLEKVTDYLLPVTSTEGFSKAEVTGGGIALDEVDRHTLESRKAPGLYLCGEMLDAYGPIGGHNFAWAWATGRMAGMAAGQPALQSPHVPIQT